VGEPEPVNRLAASGSVPTTARSGIVVTGASTGIGFATATQLAAQGFSVFGTVLHEEEGAPLERAGVIPVPMDVTVRRSVQQAHDRVQELLGGVPLRGLVNNAGIAMVGPVELQPLDELRQMFEVNVFGLVAATQAFLGLVKQSRGRIVNISSTSTTLRQPFMSAYAASKSAVEGISDCLRRELYPFGVDVIVIQLGNVRTPLWKGLGERDTSPFQDTPYQEVMGRLRDEARAVRAMAPERAAQEIVRALTMPRPPTRVLVVGRRVRFRLRSRLPDRWMDRIAARQFWGASGRT
jgi:NAD(P)-dependent dehydrogenase (short-subunit alcohol dehydrogenase family)